MDVCTRVKCKMVNGDHLHAGDSKNLMACILTCLHFVAEVPDFAA